MNVTPIHPAQEQPAEPVQPVEPKAPAPFFELRITLQRPPYRLLSAVATVAALVSLWWTR